MTATIISSSTKETFASSVTASSTERATSTKKATALGLLLVLLRVVYRGKDNNGGDDEFFEHERHQLYASMPSHRLSASICGRSPGEDLQVNGKEYTTELCLGFLYILSFP